jgi:hypothetical protein
LARCVRRARGPLASFRRREAAPICFLRSSAPLVCVCFGTELFTVAAYNLGMRAIWLLLAMTAAGCGGATAAPGRPSRHVLPWKPDGSMPSRDCSITPGSKDIAEARVLCSESDAGNCLRLIEDAHVAEEDALLARARLAAACASDPVCGCAAYGRALTAARWARRVGEAVEMLRLSCVHGAVSACDDIELMAELCERDDRENFCAALREGGRIPPRIAVPLVGSMELPPTLAGCFAVTSDGAPSSTPASEPWWRADTICEIEPDACPASKTQRQIRMP